MFAENFRLFYTLKVTGKYIQESGCKVYFSAPYIVRGIATGGKELFSLHSIHSIPPPPQLPSRLMIYENTAAICFIRVHSVSLSTGNVFSDTFFNMVTEERAQISDNR
jgi:hypothetical protein